MENNRTKKIALNTLLLIFCCVIIALFCLTPNKVLKQDPVVQKYSVNFDTDGGSAVVALEVPDGSTIEKPEDPTRDGYEFVGWMLGDEIYDFSQKVSKDITLKAYWQEIKPDVVYYTVTFDSVGGTPQGNQVVESGNLATRPVPDPVKENFTFDGWKLNGNVFNFATPITADITLVAGWTAVEPEPEPEPEPKPDEVTYTVTFNTNGGSKIGSQTVKEGATATKPKNPTRSGYTFKGWYTSLNGSTTFNFKTKITKNTTVYAQWTKNSSGGGGNSGGGGSGGSGTNPDTIKYFTVTFHRNYSSSDSTTTKKSYNTKMKDSDRTIKTKSPSLFSRAHYSFDGWKLNGNMVTSLIVRADMNLYATWSPKSYTIVCTKVDSQLGHEQCRISVSNSDGTVSKIFDSSNPNLNLNGKVVGQSTYNTSLKGKSFNIVFNDSDLAFSGKAS